MLHVQQYLYAGDISGWKIMEGLKTRRRLSTYMQDELEDKDKDYRSVPHEEWCDILYTM